MPDADDEAGDVLAIADADDETVAATAATALTRIPKDGPWGIKHIPGIDKATALAAAKRAHRAVGDWLGEAIRARVEAEREDRTGQGDVLPPERGSTEDERAVQPPGPLSIAEVADVVEIIRRIGEIEGKPANARLLAGARRVLAMRLRGALTP